MRFVLGLGAVGAALLLAGCAAPNPSGNAAGAGITGTVASEATPANVRRIGFLTDYARLRRTPGGGGMLCWRSAGVDWKQYNKVMFERIQVYLAASSKSVDPTDLKMLIDYFHNDLVRAIQSEAQVVNTAGPGVLRVRFALKDLVATNTAEGLAGTAIPCAFVAEIGSGAATGRPAGSTPYLAAAPSCSGVVNSNYQQAFVRPESHPAVRRYS